MISEETLSAAVKEYAKEFYATLPETAECDHTFSPEFEKKMRHLCHKTKYKPAYTFLKRMACAVVALILCASAFLALNTEARASVIGWIRDKYSSYARYSFAHKTGVGGTLLNYEITILPEGYTLLMRKETNAGNFMIYHNGDGKIMQLGSYTSESGALFVGGYEYDHFEVTVSGRAADLYIAKDPTHSNTIIWENAEGNVLFQLTAHFDSDCLIKLAESVSPINFLN